jgi:hypothetical protein
MRATIFLILALILCHSSAHSDVYIFKSGKKIDGTTRYENAETIRIVESNGLEMTLRKSELNLPATLAANVRPAFTAPVEVLPPAAVEQTPAPQPVVKVYTNRDLRLQKASFTPPEIETDSSWKKSLAKLEREYLRLQGACRNAGTGPNLSKVLRSETYYVNGKKLQVTGYFADPANIAEAKQICSRAIQTEEMLQQARQNFEDYLDRQKNQNNSVKAQ